MSRKVLDRYLIDHMLPKLEGKRWPTVFEIPGVEGADDVIEQGYQTLGIFNSPWLKPGFGFGRGFDLFFEAFFFFDAFFFV